MVNQYLYSVANGFKKFVEADTKEETELRRYFETLSSENFKRLGVLPKDGETAEDELSRPFVLSAALYAKNEDAIKETHDLFVASKDNLLEVSAGIRPYVLMNEVVNFSSDDLFDKLLEEYRKTFLILKMPIRSSRKIFADGSREFCPMKKVKKPLGIGFAMNGAGLKKRSAAIWNFRHMLRLSPKSSKPRNVWKNSSDSLSQNLTIRDWLAKLRWIRKLFKAASI